MKNSNGLTTLLLAMIIVAASCTEEGSNNANNTEEVGKLSLSVTDAPSDDTRISGVYMTFSELKVDGKSHPINPAKTVELSALNRGKTEVIFDDQLEAKSYSTMSLVLDGKSTDEPGCYVLTKDGRKHNLLSTTNSNELTISKKFDIKQASNNQAIVDIDLRKAVSYHNDDENQFTLNNNLDKTARVDFNHEGYTIKGKINAILPIGDDYVMVYVYEENTFDKEKEINSDIMFEGAITSCLVDPYDQFSLHYMEEGTYDLVPVKYSEEASGRLSPDGFLSIGLAGNLDLQTINLNSNTNINLDVTSLIDL